MIKRIIILLTKRVYHWLKGDNPDKIKFKKRGTNVVIGGGGSFFNPESISLGNNIYIGHENYFAGVGGLTIEDNVSFGPRVNIHTSNHRYEHGFYLPYDGVSIKRPVHVESNVWIGGHVTIVPGVRIAEGAIVAMGAVVTKNVPKCAVVGGNPAKILKYRDLENYEKLKKEGRSFLEVEGKGLVNYKYVNEDEKDLIKEEEFIKKLI